MNNCELRALFPDVRFNNYDQDIAQCNISPDLLEFANEGFFGSGLTSRNGCYGIQNCCGTQNCCSNQSGCVGIRPLSAELNPCNTPIGSGAMPCAPVNCLCPTPIMPFDNSRMIGCNETNGLNYNNLSYQFGRKRCRRCCCRCCCHCCHCCHSCNSCNNCNNCNDNPGVCGFTFSVTDSNSGATIAGATFEVVDSLGRTYTATSGANGMVSFELPRGIFYTLSQTSAPFGYETTTDIHTIQTDWNCNVYVDGAYNPTFSVTNTPLSTSYDFSFLKLDATSMLPLAGATFSLSPSFRGVYAATSDASGKVLFKGVAPGVYRLHEIAAPAGYTPDDTIYTVTVEADGTVTVDGATINGFYVANERNAQA